MKTAGIVLAGGLSRRFGSPKAFLKMGDRYFYERAVDTLKSHCEEVIIVSRHELLKRYPAEVKVITDLPEVSGSGPLAGILSGIEFVEADRYIVLPCDMPFVDESVIGNLIKYHDKGITAVIASGKYHPLVSVWERKSKSKIKNALQNGQLSVMKLLDKIDVTWVEGNLLTENEESVFENMNTPADFERRLKYGNNT